MRVLSVLFFSYLIAVHWLGWWRALAVPVGVLVLMLIAVKIFTHFYPEATSGDTPDGDAGHDAEETTAQNDFPELKPAIASLEAGAFARCIRQAEPYTADARTALRADALRLCAISWSRLEDHAQALPYWRKLASIEDTPDNWLNVATSRAMTQDFTGAAAAFDLMQRRNNTAKGAAPGKTIFMPTETANYLTALDRAGRPDLAMPLLDQLADFYRSLHITDPTFLHIRGMPFFGTFLENSGPIVRKVKSADAVRDWYRAIYDDVDADGKASFDRLNVSY